MKKLLGLAAVGALLSFTSVQAAFDGTIGTSDTPGRTGFGGPFTINVMSASSAAMQQVAAMGSTYMSFCLEQSETISIAGNQGYKVQINTAAVNGGIGGGNPDPLSLATAWLYSKFRSAGSTGLDALFIANSGSVAAGRTALQQAIWYLEQEQNTGNNYLVSAAVAALTSYGVTAGNVRTINANGAFGVRVLNLFSADGRERRQDQLALVPEPSTYVAGALLLIPVLAQIRRWKRSV